MAKYVQYVWHHSTKEEAEKRLAEALDYYWGYDPRLVGITQEQDGQWRCHVEMRDSCD